MLSIEDIKKEIGQNIFIHPLNEDNIKANSLNLTASKYAWSIKTKKSIFNNDEKLIIIEPGETVLIYTKECIYVSNKIGGTYHSKVSLVSKGLSHIGTTLDPEYLGLSLISVKNNSNEPIKIKEGDSFISIVFYYLKTPTYEKSHNNEAGQVSILNEYHNTDDFNKFISQNDWTVNLRKLKQEMLNSEYFNDMKKNIKEENKRRHKIAFRVFKNPIVKYIFTFIALILCYVVFNFANKKLEWNIKSEYIIIPLITTLGAIVIADIQKIFE